MCTAMRGPFIVAGCGKLSPRVDNRKVSGGVCPHPHMFVVNLGLGFWSMGRRGGGVWVSSSLYVTKGSIEDDILYRQPQCNSAKREQVNFQHYFQRQTLNL